MKAIIEQGFFVTLFKELDKFFRWLAIWFVTLFTKVDDKKVIFLNFTGNYDCNPKGVCEGILKAGYKCKLVWTVMKNTRTGPMFFPPKVKTVERYSYNFYRQLASAKVIVDNGISTSFVGYHKKHNQYLVETWHGSLGIKRFGRSSNKDKSWLRKAAREGRMTDFIISNSDMEDDIYREDFWKKTEIWKFGHARNDILFADEKTIAGLNKSIREEFGIPMDAKLCMYAPTFRDDGDLRPYSIDYDRLKEALTTRFGGEWVILTRYHARTRKFMKWDNVPKSVVDVGSHPDIQELMAIIDVGITDYSSWICEYMLRRKPGFTFATDAENYATHERSLFFPLSALPFPTSSNSEELVQAILSFDEEKFVKDCDAFLKDKGSVDDGHAGERAAEAIRKLIYNEKR